jgi:hypothetical protein
LAINKGGFDGSNGYGITYGSNVWIAVGASRTSPLSTIQRSTDGFNWLAANKGGFDGSNGYGIAYTNNVGASNKFVAVGQGSSPQSSIQISTDGSNWRNVYSYANGFDSAIGYGVAYDGSGQWVAVGQSSSAVSTIQNSTDGFNWSAVSKGGFDSGPGRGVNYGDGRWVAVGQSSSPQSSIQTSIDGLNWFNVTTYSYGFDAGPGYGVAWNGSNLYVAVGNGSSSRSTIQTSYDGVTWTAIISGGFTRQIGYGIAYGSNIVTTSTLWVAVGSSTTTRGSIQISSDATHWSSALTGGFSNLIGGYIGGYGVAYDGSSQWVAVGYGGTSVPNTIQSSTDAFHWSSTPNNGFDGFNGYGVVYGSNVWIAVGKASSAVSTIQVSIDATTWFAASNSGFDGLEGRGIAYGLNLWVAVGKGSSPLLTIQSSTDGFNWIPASNGGFDGNVGYGISFDTGTKTWIAVGKGSSSQSSIQNSTDGYHWSSASNGGFTNTIGYGVTNNSSNQWIVVGDGLKSFNTIQNSTDGLNWDNAANYRNGFDGSNGYGVAYGSNLWVAVGKASSPQSTIQVSIDTTTWVIASNGGFDSLEGYGVAYGLNQWVAVGKATSPLLTIQSSTDGFYWLPASNGGFDSLEGYGVAYGLNQWVAVGKASSALSTIQTSTDGFYWSQAITGGFTSKVGYGISFNSGTNIWVAVGESTTSIGSTIQTSTDGFNWSPALNGGFSNHIGYGVANNSSNQWIVLGSGIYSQNSIQTSVNGTTWTNVPVYRDGFDSGIGYGVSYGNNRWVAVGQASSPYSTILTSVDGFRWSQAITGGFDSNIGYSVKNNGLLGSSNLWIAVGKASSSQSTIQSSTDGFHWSPTPNLTILGVSTIQVSQLSTTIEYQNTGIPITSMTTGYKGGLWLTTDGYNQSNTNPILSVWGTRNTQPDKNAFVGSAWQIFYPFQKIILTKIGNTYNPITDLAYLDYPEYPHTQMFYYSNKTKFLEDTTNKWGQEVSTNFTVADTNLSGYNFNSYIFDVPLKASVGSNDFQYLTIRGYTPTESSETFIRFVLPNKYDFGYPTQFDLISEISTLKLNTQISNFSVNYAYALSNFDAAFNQSNNYFGQGILPNFNGSNIPTSNFQQFASNVSTLWNTYQTSSSTLQGITTAVNTDMLNYISTTMKYIIPASQAGRLNFTNPITFKVLWKTSLLPQYTSLLQNWGLGYNIGFAKVDTPNYTTYTKAASFYKILDDYIYLRLNPEFKMNRLDTTSYENLKVTRDATGQTEFFYCKLLLNNFNSYSSSLIQNQSTFNPLLGRLETMYFEWVDINGIQLDDAQCDWSTSLTITENKTKSTPNTKQPILPLLKSQKK